MGNGIQLLDAASFKQAVKDNPESAPEDIGVRKMFTPISKEISREMRQIRFVISTGAVDRDDDTIDPMGWDLENYRKNPVVLWAHNSRELPCAKSLEVGIDRGMLTSLAQFPTREVHPFADTVFQLYAEGYMNATSVGFQPKRWEIVDDETRSYGYNFLEQELLEYSCVPVPCNPEALVQARAKGIDTAPLIEWAEHVLDGEDPDNVRLLVPRSALEALQKAANEKSPIQHRVRKGENPTGRVTLTEEDQASLVYRAAEGPARISNVCDGKISLMADEKAGEKGDFATADELNAAEIRAGFFATCKAEGLVRFGAAPAHDLTCDVAPEEKAKEETASDEPPAGGNEPADPDMGADEPEKAEDGELNVKIGVDVEDEAFAPLKALIERAEKAAERIERAMTGPAEPEIDFIDDTKAEETIDVTEAELAELIGTATKKAIDRITGKLPD